MKLKKSQKSKIVNQFEWKTPCILLLHDDLEVTAMSVWLIRYRLGSKIALDDYYDPSIP